MSGPSPRAQYHALVGCPKKLVRESTMINVTLRVAAMLLLPIAMIAQGPAQVSPAECKIPQPLL